MAEAQVIYICLGAIWPLNQHLYILTANGQLDQSSYRGQRNIGHMFM